MDIQEIVRKQRAYFATEATLDISARRAKLLELKACIEAHEDEICAALRSDLGKSDFEGYMCEVGLTLAELSDQLKHLRKRSKPRRRHTDLANFAGRSWTVAEPYGVTLVMSPWNYPFMLTMEPLIAAVATGNCCVVKPSAYSSATSDVIAKIVAQVFEPEHVSVVLGGRAENTALLEQRFDYIFFTGGLTVGKLVLEKASKWATPVSLELGGKSPCIITSSADLKIAARRLAFGKWLNVGQTCVAPDYVLIDESVHKRFIPLLKAEVERQYGKDALANPDYGHIVNRKHFDRLLGLIDSEKVIHGGAVDGDALRIAPVIMNGCTREDAVMQEEIFGPLLPLITYKTLDEAKDFVRAGEKPLALYLFTKDKSVERDVLKTLSYGGGCVNDCIVHMATSSMPFGGVGASGMGGYHGQWSFDSFSHIKSIHKKYCGVDMPMRYQPYLQKWNKIIHLLLK